MQEEVEPVVNDLEIHRADLKLLLDRHAKRTVPAIRWNVFGRVLLKLLPGIFADEVIQLAVVSGREFLFALQRQPRQS